MAVGLISKQQEGCRLSTCLTAAHILAIHREKVKKGFYYLSCSKNN